MSSSSKQQEAGPKLFSSRMLSRDRSSVANASFRVYYNSLGAGTVPFLWESKPGTPKSSVTPASSAASAVPPISPPPSYLQSAVSQSEAKTTKFRRKRSSSWPPGGWIIGWLNLNVRRRRRSRSPPSSPTDRQQRCLGRDHAGDERRRSTLCF